MIGRLLYDSQREIACALEILIGICRAADMDAWEDELASLADELSTNYLAPRKIQYGMRAIVAMLAMQALRHHVCLGMCSILVDICRYHWLEEAGESWAGVGEVS